MTTQQKEEFFKLVHHYDKQVELTINNYGRNRFVERLAVCQQVLGILGLEEEYKAYLTSNKFLN